MRKFGHGSKFFKSPNAKESDENEIENDASTKETLEKVAEINFDVGNEYSKEELENASINLAYEAIGEEAPEKEEPKVSKTVFSVKERLLKNKPRTPKKIEPAVIDVEVDENDNKEPQEAEISPEIENASVDIEIEKEDENEALNEEDDNDVFGITNTDLLPDVDNDGNTEDFDRKIENIKSELSKGKMSSSDIKPFDISVKPLDIDIYEEFTCLAKVVKNERGEYIITKILSKFDNEIDNVTVSFKI